MDIHEAQKRVLEHDRARGWDTFHPLEIFANMNEEMAEIWQRIAWVPEDEKRVRAARYRDEIEHDIGDLLHLLLKLANQFEVDPERGLLRALATHAKNHPPREGHDGK